MNQSSWLNAVPFAGYPYSQAGHPYMQNPYAMAGVQRSIVRVGATDGATSPFASPLVVTAIGIAIVAGGGGLVGYLVGKTKVAALWGALVGLAAPPLFAAAKSEWGPAPDAKLDAAAAASADAARAAEAAARAAAARAGR